MGKSAGRRAATVEMYVDAWFSKLTVLAMISEMSNIRDDFAVVLKLSRKDGSKVDLVVHACDDRICVDGNAGSSEAVAALHALSHSKALRYDLLLFCAAAALGKILIYGIMAQYGSLTCITIGVTRKVFTILVSVLVFGHHFCHEMWAGVGLVALGLAMEVSTSTTGADMLSQKEKSE